MRVSPRSLLARLAALRPARRERHNAGHRERYRSAYVDRHPQPAAEDSGDDPGGDVKATKP